MSLIKLVMAQINPLVGDIEGNTQQVIQNVIDAQNQYQADVVIFPELTLCGYPPEDLLLRESMAYRIKAAQVLLSQQHFSATVIVGYPKVLPAGHYNMAGVLQQKQWITEYAKQKLPNFQVFDEKRYFTAGKVPCVFKWHGIKIALSICEDIWHEEPLLQVKKEGVDLLININASPFHRQKQQQRLDLLSKRAQQGNMSIIYVNQVGGQDELVFDGGSFAVNPNGECQVLAPLYQQGLYLVNYAVGSKAPIMFSREAISLPSGLEVTYNALVLGLKDYVNKNHFNSVVLGLSGGIDSALTLVIAVDALGPERVHAVMMPFLYTSQLSQDDASEQARNLGVKYDNISIEPMYNAFMEGLKTQFEGRPTDLTEQNLQARCRGVLLMAISNKMGALVLTTGNKSELAVGYSTLYGDMAGGFDVLKDVPKTLVYALAEYRNTLEAEVIPRSVIQRPPSAELAPGQKDEDNLPPYDILDQILERYIDEDKSAHAIIADGFDSETVHRVIRLVDLNEYKRRQAPIGVRISKKGFGRDRRYPVTNGWAPGC
ncbi:NAD+ synthase [Candidatus Endobugula sertula]|uniref:Glutamine-dependent NAD(+) synthetase n=1 Tax=Candidatus Endobugula sertula TaxID=62101 RepID=A0A1D2QTF4_9GAMM|nr:NAD+ synthase [Candidatus Endobugula sertula]